MRFRKIRNARVGIVWDFLIIFLGLEWGWCRPGVPKRFGLKGQIL